VSEGWQNAGDHRRSLPRVLTRSYRHTHVAPMPTTPTPDPKPTWKSTALVGFVAGVITVILVVLALR